MAEAAKSAAAASYHKWELGSDQELEKWYADETGKGKTDRQFGEILIGIMCEYYEWMLKELKEDPTTTPIKVSKLRDTLSYGWNISSKSAIYHAYLEPRTRRSPAERIRKLQREFEDLVTQKKEFPAFVKTSETAPDEQLQAWYEAKKKEGLTERQIGYLIIEPMCANYESALRAADAAALAQEADRWFHPMGRYDPFFGEHGRGMGPIIVDNFKTELSIYWNFQSKDEPAPKRMRRLYRQYEYVISGEKDRREMIGMALMGEWLPIASYKPPAGGGRTPGPTSGNTGPGGKGGSSGQRLPGPEGTGGKGTGTGVKQDLTLGEILVGPKGGGGGAKSGPRPDVKAQQIGPGKSSSKPAAVPAAPPPKGAFQGVGPLQGKTIGEIRNTLQANGFKQTKAAKTETVSTPNGNVLRTDNKGGSEIWVRKMPDGSYEAVRIDELGHNVNPSWAGAKPHVHKEVVPGNKIQNYNQEYVPEAVGHADDGMPIADPKSQAGRDAAHIPVQGGSSSP